MSILIPWKFQELQFYMYTDYCAIHNKFLRPKTVIAILWNSSCSSHERGWSYQVTSIFTGQLRNFLNLLLVLPGNTDLLRWQLHRFLSPVVTLDFKNMTKEKKTVLTEGIFFCDHSVNRDLTCMIMCVLPEWIDKIYLSSLGEKIAKICSN